MNEIWKPVVDFENYYEVSSLGNVRTIDRYACDKNGKYRHIKLKQITKQIDRSGYYKVDIKNDVERKTIAIHRLVAQAFLPNSENKPCVNHIDGNKLNNSITNLEWATYSENNKHAIDTGLRKSPWTGKFGLNNPVSKPVYQLDKMGNIINNFVNAREAENITGISHKHISCCCNGKRKTTGGYCWKFQ